MTRRVALAGTVGWAAATPGFAASLPFEPAVVAIERRLGGRVGAAIWDLGNGARAGWRQGERFPFCSTIKVALAGALLARIDRGGEDAARRIQFSPTDVVAYSPVTRDRVGGAGMSVAEIAEALVARGDNTAANLAVAALGGPAAFTAWLRSIGDETTRLDRTETALNEGRPGDPRDTTTPEAMLDDLRRLLFGDVLQPASRDRLAAWMIANDTGARRLRAGLPGTWRVGDRTGTGGNGAASCIAVAWPPGRAPILVAVYLHGSSAAPAQLDEAIAAVGGLVAAAV